ncbi:MULTISPECIES: LCP family protein [Geobacillus]|uniref:LCP family protein n=1 Tax=Geobacillus TaxID=129337 RepID=UPI0004265552|nr:MULTISPECIES: LCP family protein [Geobacillus]AOL35797.1 transcriptional regulator [Geobacillus thermoleovorans]TRY36600.1 LytR family transcriptional regulator [Geobacillus sp. LEMMJ02]WMJ19749.1 LCP family protein [Geobacillus kaustophilus]GAJ57414.1 attenuator role for lytABC and lytR expression [Geobacillus thermoleovorans B23]
MNENRRYQMKRKRKKRKRIFKWVILPILLFLFSSVAYSGYLFYKTSAIAQSAQKLLARGEKSEKRIAPVDPKHDNISILFVGVDDSEKRRLGGKTRADALILATFNRKERTIKMVSIPRDSYVYIPVEQKRDKINHSHVFGDIDGTIETVEQLFDIPVDYYVRLNFNAFIQIIDTLGGIDMYVPVTFTEQDSKDRAKAIHLEKGYQHLNGEQALALARTRKIDNDLERGKRQQLILEAIIQKALSIKSITKYDDLIETLGNNITTNMSFGELLSLYTYALKEGGVKIERYQLTGSDMYLHHTYYFRLDEQKVQEISQMLKNHLELNETRRTFAQNKTA